MKRTIRRSIKRISLKNMLAPLIIGLLAALAGFVIPFEEMFVPDTASDANEVITIVKEGALFIEVDTSELIYTGYDHFDSSGEASFYYLVTQENDACVFFLIDSDEEEESVRGRIISKKGYVKAFLTEYAAELGLSYEALNELSGGYIVSAHDYNFFIYALTALIIALLVALCVIFLAGNILIFFFPAAHTSCRRLKKYGLSGRDFSDIDRELQTDTIIEAGNMFATSHYLIVFGKSTLYMVPLFNIVWAYSFAKRKLSVSKRLRSYALVIYTSPGGKIVMRGNRKRDAQEILAFLERDFSHIEVGYSRQKKKRFKELFKKGELWKR